jgi:hypothetical protein
MTFSVNCHYNTAATLYALETWFDSGTVHTCKFRVRNEITNNKIITIIININNRKLQTPQLANQACALRVLHDVSTLKVYRSSVSWNYRLQRPISTACPLTVRLNASVRYRTAP